MIEDVQAEMEAARQSLRAAERLSSDGLTRDGASRVYFAMFHAASAMLLAEGMRFRSHKETISAFGRAFAKERRIDPKYHRYLIDAEDLREVADYGTHAIISPENVTQAIEQATEFVAMAETFLEGTGGPIE
jgi:uncharacterized protein (UPF0332 family)